MKKIICVAVMVAGTAFATTTHARVERCSASWYGGKTFEGKDMANGQPFDQHNPNHLAHKTLPFGTKLEVTNLLNGKTLRATVTDRGPFIRGRCVDLSRAGASQLGFLSRGHAPVQVRVVN